MVKLVIAKQKKKHRATSVVDKQVVGESGRTIKVMTVDASSRSLGDDLLYVFRRNVARHRRQNVAGKKS